MSSVFLIGGATVSCSLGLMEPGWMVLICSISVCSSMLSVCSCDYSLISEWIGTDEMSILLVVLTGLTTIISLVSSCKDLQGGGDFPGEPTSSSMLEVVGFVCLSSLMFFSCSSWMDFYFFFELALVPTFFLILKWGYRPERLQAGTAMMLYTVSSSLPLLMGLVWAWSEMQSDNMLLAKMVCGFQEVDMKWPWVFMCLGFLVKFPLYGVHGWLPKAHVEAPLSGSMLLAGILLKFGGYGMIRFMWFSEICETTVTQVGLVVTMWGGVLSAATCMTQSDVKAFIAYSSVSHMAMSLGSLLTFYSLGKMACVSLMFAHGLCSPILFSLAASSYDISASRNIMITKGVLFFCPAFSLFWFLICMLNMGVPPSLNFYSEAMCVGSMLWKSYFFATLAGMVCLISGCYCLVLYGMVSHGNFSFLGKSFMGMSSRYLVSAAFVCMLLFMGGFSLDLFFA